jgi:hypothetical protein
MTLSDYANMSDRALTAYLFGLAVGCPLGLGKHDCPLLELQDDNLSAVYDLLLDLGREEKLRLAARHYGCAEWVEGRVSSCCAPNSTCF